MKLSTIVSLFAFALALVACRCLCGPHVYPAELEEALVEAGDHRAELEKVLAHFREDDRDPLMYDAACFLIANMQGHGYAEYALVDEEGNEIEFDALEYADFGKARAALEALEQEHGTLDFEVQTLTPDLEVIEADFLITHMEKAFEAWRTWPWARDLSYEAFREHILPYRGSNEPLEDWRTPLMARIEEVVEKIDDPTDPRQAAGSVGGVASVGFRELYYLHPTDQGFAEMDERRVGRCEDITNMTMYVNRAACIPSAQDYTPHWANRDNNHAWPVFLDENGEGAARQGGVAAKIYRKTFSQQRGNLAFHLREGEEGPRWLNRRTYMDVTDQYMVTTDVTVELTNEIPDGHRFAYLCVFNGGEWKAIHWGRIENGGATFDRMGRGIAYLPAYYVDEELVPAAPPFFLDAEEWVLTFVGEPSSPISCELPGKAGAAYELFVWEGGWKSVGRGEGGEEPMRFEGVPAGGLYWLVADGSRRLERIFRLEADGTPRFM